MRADKFNTLMQFLIFQDEGNSIYCIHSEQDEYFWFRFNFETGELTEQSAYVELTENQLDRLLLKINEFIIDKGIELQEEKDSYVHESYWDEYERNGLKRSDFL